MLLLTKRGVRGGKCQTGYEFAYFVQIVRYWFFLLNQQEHFISPYGNTLGKNCDSRKRAPAASCAGQLKFL